MPIANVGDGSRFTEHMKKFESATNDEGSNTEQQPKYHTDLVPKAGSQGWLETEMAAERLLDDPELIG